MNYEEKYKEALERARKLYERGTITESLSHVFPELAESDDERIRKNLLGYIKGVNEREVCKETLNEWIAWLEKQGEQKPDKVEPKFRNGQWIVWQDKCYKVNDNGCGYELVDQNGLSTSLEYGTIDENAHLWDITKDAKDGDVLSDGTTIFIIKDLLSDGSVMSYCDYDTDSGESDAFCPLSMNLMCSKITPATKEQRDQLEKAMADAGYIFDFEKKKLKKIEQKPAWSEDDEEMLNSIIEDFGDGKTSNMLQEYWLKSLKGRVLPQPKQEWNEEDEKCIRLSTDIIDGALRAGFCVQLDRDRCVDWLKSLRPQNTWKPSDEQIKTCKEVYADILSAKGFDVGTINNELNRLEEQLKNL